jgi:hypothetical protein
MYPDHKDNRIIFALTPNTSPPLHNVENNKHSQHAHGIHPPGFPEDFTASRHAPPTTTFYTGTCFSYELAQDRPIIRPMFRMKEARKLDRFYGRFSSAQP